MKWIICHLLSAVLCGLLLWPVSATADLERDLVLHLPLTSDLEDHSPARHPIEVVGNVRIESDGAYFGGRMDWLEAPFIALNERPFAVAVWIKETSRERHVGLVEQFDLHRHGHYLHLMLRENRQPYLGFFGRDLISPVGVPREQEWMHVVFQYTGQLQQIWINGHLVANSRAAAYQGSTGATVIGKAPRWGNVPAQDFIGHMRDFRIYHRTLEVGEMAALAGPLAARGTDPGAAAGGAAEAPALPRELAPSLIAILPEDKDQPFLEIEGGRVIINGRPGQIYVLQSTADFVTWTPLKWFTNDTGRVTYTEDDAHPAVRFYRVLVEGNQPTTQRVESDE